VSNYRTKDDRFDALCCLQPGRYWGEACQVLGRPELASDERFTDAATIVENGGIGRALFAEAFAERTLDEWRDRLNDFSGQWAVVQDTLEAAADPQTVANGYVVECETSDGMAFKLAAAPVQFDEEPPQPKRAPEFNEHGDAILEALGIDWDTIIDLKVRGVVA
jgi:crotonobetainyl-CoA:carnitine CoA-transferase CaiB-like acyl-CoA transferase